MIERRLALSLLAALATACSSSPKADGGVGAGPADAGIDAGEDGGEGDAGCATAGYSCDADIPCCDTLEQVCDPVEQICVFVQSDGGGGNGFPNDGAQWLEENVTAAVAGLDGLSVPSPAQHVAVGSGPGLGQILQRSNDGGWSVVPGVPPAVVLSGIWADPSGDVFAVGQQDGGLPLWIAGNLDGGLRQVNLSGLFAPDGGAGFASLDSVLGLGPGEALAVGTATFSNPATALHLWPDGGVTIEPLPSEVTRAYGLVIAGDGGLVYALAAYLDTVLVLQRNQGAWTEAEVFGVGVASSLVVGPLGSVTVVGDDGSGHGQVFTYLDAGNQHVDDGGYFPLQGLPASPPFTAACEPTEGEFYLAASAANQPLELLHVDGGLQNGTWWSETLPADAQTISAIAGDGAGTFFAVGVRTCPDCAGYPLALRRVP